MMGWVLLFLAIAVIAAIFGFGGVAAGVMAIAKIIFWIFVILFVISLVVALTSRGRWGPRTP